jgi:hypothetical protein
MCHLTPPQIQGRVRGIPYAKPTPVGSLLVYDVDR